MQIARLCALLRELRDTGPMTLREIADVLGAPYDSVWHWLRMLDAGGIARACGRRGSASLWGLSPPGTEPGRPYSRPGNYRVKPQTDATPPP